MDSSEDNSFIAFEHLEDLNISVTGYINKSKAEFERKETFLESKLLPAIKFINESFGINTDKNVLFHTETKVSRLKKDLEIKTQILKELNIKIEILETELKQLTENVSSKENDDLLREVLQLEREKYKRIEKLLQRRDTIIKYMQYYKQFLDCHITFSKPDIYTFYFNKICKNGNLPNKWIKLRSDDCKHWQFTDATIDSEQKGKILHILEETGNIQRVLCKIQEMLTSNT